MKWKVRRFRLAHRLRSSLWFIPLLCVIGGVGLSFATIAADRLIGEGTIPQSFTGGPDAALAVLETIAASMVTLTALVLTITMVVIQLAMGQFSPRIVRSILADRPSQLAIGFFVATFAHAMLAMREVKLDGNGGAGTVPGIAIIVGFLLVVASIMVLVLYVHHIGTSLRVSALIELVGSDTRKLVDHLYPQGEDEETRGDEERDVIPAPRSGVVFKVDVDDLVDLAREADCCIELIPAIGDFVPAGGDLMRVHGASPDASLNERATELVALGPERTLNQDVAYGMRMLVDIAERQLAETFTDPTTAVQAIDRLHDCLRQLARREFPSGRHVDRDGTTRLVMPTLDWEGYLRLAFDEIRIAGAASPQIPRRLRAALEDLRRVAPPERRPPIDRQLALLEEAVAEAGAPGAPLADVEVADAQGIGSGDDVRVAVGLERAGR